jgi:hypothetical protein
MRRLRVPGFSRCAALNKGLTGPEHPDTRQAKDARIEIEALWAAVKKLIAKGTAR